jgi:hypothetical protein
VVERLDVVEVVDRRERVVRHPELLALVDVRRPAVHVEHRAEHLGGLGAAVAEAGDDARLVVVVPVQAVPAALGQADLPAVERRLEVDEPQRVHVELVRALVELDVLELEHHVDLAARRVREESRLVEGHAGHLSHGQQPVVPGREDLAVHLLEELVDARAAEVMG